MQVHPPIVDDIIEMKIQNSELVNIVNNVQIGKLSDYSIDFEGLLRLKYRLCVSNISGFRIKILEETHSSSYTIHLGSNKMYQDLREFYYWEGIKRNVAKFVSKCLVYPHVKAEPQKLIELLTSIDILEWKWEDITMNFVIELPQIPKRYDIVLVIIDQLTKPKNFLHTKAINTTS